VLGARFQLHISIPAKTVTPSPAPIPIIVFFAIPGSRNLGRIRKPTSAAMEFIVVGAPRGANANARSRRRRHDRVLRAALTPGDALDSLPQVDAAGTSNSTNVRLTRQKP
jgi:hypothetical protein